MSQFWDSSKRTHLWAFYLLSALALVTWRHGVRLFKQLLTWCNWFFNTFKVVFGAIKWLKHELGLCDKHGRCLASTPVHSVLVTFKFKCTIIAAKAGLIRVASNLNKIWLWVI